jgi:hypothetical protein
MTIVALDACGRYAISALRRGDETLYAVSDGGVGAVRAVYSSVDRVMAKGGIGAGDVSAIVVNTGPGSWTGVRVSVTYTAGLAFGAGTRVYGYSGFAIGKRLAGGVAFIDQLGKTVAEEGAVAPLTVELFAEIDAGAYLSGRQAWLDQMVAMGAEALAAGEAGDPLELKTTYFQEFLAGVRK